MVIGRSKLRSRAAGYAKFPGNRPEKIGRPTRRHAEKRTGGGQASVKYIIDRRADRRAGRRVAAVSRPKRIGRMYPAGKGREEASGRSNDRRYRSLAKDNTLEGDVTRVDKDVGLKADSPCPRRRRPRRRVALLRLAAGMD